MATRRKTPLQPKRRKPESLRLRDIAASLTVNDLQASLAWYRASLAPRPVGCIFQRLNAQGDTHGDSTQDAS